MIDESFIRWRGYCIVDKAGSIRMLKVGITGESLEPEIFANKESADAAKKGGERVVSCALVIDYSRKP